MRRRRRRLGHGALAGYAFVFPSLVGVAAFLLLPVVAVFLISLVRWNYVADPVFVGFNNYVRILSDPQVINAFRVSGLYVLLVVPLQTILALYFAVQLNKRIRGRTIFRLLFVLPWLATPVVLGIVFNWIFDPRYGALDGLLRYVGATPVNWLTDPFWALPSLALVNIWQFTGYTMILFMAGLQSIPEHLYEAASIDGAGPSRIFFSLTLPLLSPTVLFVLVTAIIGSFQVFDTVSVMTAGGPGDATRVVNFLIYQKAFQFFDAGGASALAALLFLVIFVVTLVQFRFFRERIVQLG